MGRNHRMRYANHGGHSPVRRGLASLSERYGWKPVLAGILLVVPLCDMLATVAKAILDALVTPCIIGVVVLIAWHFLAARRR